MENLVELGFLWSVSYIKSTPTHEQNILLWEEVVRMPLITIFFLGWVGLGFGEFVGFIIMFTCFPTEFGKWQTP